MLSEGGLLAGRQEGRASALVDSRVYNNPCTGEVANKRNVFSLSSYRARFSMLWGACGLWGMLWGACSGEHVFWVGTLGSMLWGACVLDWNSGRHALGSMCF
eukprot:15194381-Heterocapsa_arctica.AAC.1